jgi:C4-dicarboxylate transporter, DctM subunit
MSILQIGLLFGASTCLVLFSGMPIAFALGSVATVFMYFFMPHASLDTVAQNVYEEMASITLLTIPLFILKGAAIGKSKAGRDLYSAMHIWLSKIPGGLGIAVTLACGLFAAMAGSSAATCSAIGSSAIPEMRQRGYSSRLAAGLVAAGGTLGILLPPSVTLILYAVAAEQSLGRLFLAGIGPGVLLVVLFALYGVFRFQWEQKRAQAVFDAGGEASRILQVENYTFIQKLTAIPRVLPFLVLLLGVMFALYGGFATPSETAGLGAVLALMLIALVYGAWRLSDLKPIFLSSLSEATMLMMIIGMSLLYSYVMSYLHISQSAAEWIVALHLGKWTLFMAVALMVVVLGFFLPPVSIILMTAPIILPPLRAQGFDLIWFGVVMSVIMEMGLIHPPVGLNIFVINKIAPDIELIDVVWGTIPFVFLILFAVLLLCVFPQIVDALPLYFYGPQTLR